MTQNKNTIKIVPYNDEWPSLFQEEAARIEQHLANACQVIHHIGSTSVPGLAAKPVIDILCVVDSLPSSTALCEMGYEFRGELNIPLRYFFRKKTSTLDVNLHVTEEDNGFVQLNLCFRDYLRQNEKIKNEYAALKNQLALAPDAAEKVQGLMPRYTLEKNAFIKKVLQQAGFNGLILNFCFHTLEWEAYHRLKEQEMFAHSPHIYNRQHPDLTAPNHYHFVLYKGTSIIACAHIEFMAGELAALRALVVDAFFKHHEVEACMLKQLKKWLLYQQKRLV